MLNSTSHQGTINQRHNYISFDTHQDGCDLKKNVTTAGEDVENWNSVQGQWECEMVQLLWKTVEIPLEN